MTTFIEGETISLRVLSLQNLEGGYPNWLNDPEVNLHNSHHVFPYTLAQARNYIESVSRDEHNIVLAIVDKATNTHIGNVALQKIDPVSHNAEYALILGEKSFWGKGVGFEASKLMIKHGFETLNLHRIYCGTSSENVAMQKLATKLGFKEEGRRKEAHFKNDSYQDILEYGLLKSDWQNL